MSTTAGNCDNASSRAVRFYGSIPLGKTMDKCKDVKITCESLGSSRYPGRYESRLRDEKKKKCCLDSFGGENGQSELESERP